MSPKPPGGKAAACLTGIRKSRHSAKHPAAFSQSQTMLEEAIPASNAIHPAKEDNNAFPGSQPFMFVDWMARNQEDLSVLPLNHGDLNALTAGADESSNVAVFFTAGTWPATPVTTRCRSEFLQSPSPTPSVLMRDQQEFHQQLLESPPDPAVHVPKSLRKAALHTQPVDYTTGSNLLTREYVMDDDGGGEAASFIASQSGAGTHSPTSTSSSSSPASVYFTPKNSQGLEPPAVDFTPSPLFHSQALSVPAGSQSMLNLMEGMDLMDKEPVQQMSDVEIVLAEALAMKDNGRGTIVAEKYAVRRRNKQNCRAWLSDNASLWPFENNLVRLEEHQDQLIPKSIRIRVVKRRKFQAFQPRPPKICCPIPQRRGPQQRKTPTEVPAPAAVNIGPPPICRIKDKKKRRPKKTQRGAKWRHFAAIKNRLNVGNNESFEFWQQSTHEDKELQTDAGRDEPQKETHFDATIESLNIDFISDDEDTVTTVTVLTADVPLDVDIFVTAPEEQLASTSALSEMSNETEQEQIERLLEEWATTEDPLCFGILLRCQMKS